MNWENHFKITTYVFKDDVTCPPSKLFKTIDSHGAPHHALNRNGDPVHVRSDFADGRITTVYAGAGAHFALQSRK